MSRPMSVAALALLSTVGLMACQPTQPDAARGAVFYRATCATCHDSGSPPQAPDLTQLAAANGGRFPADRVTGSVDGRAGLRAHGSPMPVWGRVLTP